MKIIDIDYNHPDLMVQDRRAVAAIISKANQQIDAGDLLPLRLTIQSYLAAIEDDTYIDPVASEQHVLQMAINDALGEGDQAAATSLEAVKRSRKARADILENYYFELENLLGA